MTSASPDSSRRPDVLPGPAQHRPRPGIAHIGVGAFHRSHQAWYVQDLLDRGLAADWGIVGIGVMPQDSAVIEALRSQDFRYTVLVKRPDGMREARVIRSLVDAVVAPVDPARALQILTSPEIRLVTLTITEGGYHVDQTTGELVLDSELLADARGDETPTTAAGYLVEALASRREREVAPFAVASCDNLPGNGVLARRLVVGLAQVRDPGLADWIDNHVAFPSSMVDRITPAATEHDRDLLRTEFGIDDACPVVCESHIQWVLEDRFPSGRPPFELVGVQLVDDVEPYENLKLRILNAGHQLLAQLGRLLGLSYVHEAAHDADLATLFTHYVQLEAAPTVQPLRRTDPISYGRQALERFGNPQIEDPLSRICTDASDRIPKFLLPVVRDQLARGGPVRASALVVAAWARAAEGHDDDGRLLQTTDRRGDEIADAARRSAADPVEFLRDPTLFGDLADSPVFSAAFAEALTSLRAHGARATVRNLIRPTDDRRSAEA
jgi:mannitol 2-dehydrogenase